MSRPRLGRTALVRRLLTWQALDEFMPIFPVYALLFADAGLSATEISVLLVVWSTVAFVLEIPSGAWADTVSRRLLLSIAALTYAAAFATWNLVPTFAGFTIGFLLWGLSGALSSGTFQALAYDELAAVGARDAYARVLGLGTSLALGGMALATLLAAPLVAIGGYPLAGWVSVGVCLVQFLVTRSLPATPPVISASDAGAAEEADPAELIGLEASPDVVVARAGSFWSSYLRALRTGLREATTSRLVRGAVLASATLAGLLAFDEYFGLLLDEHGASLVVIPLLLTVVTVGQALGGLLAERAASWPSPVLAGVVALAGLGIGVGAVVRHPIGIVAVGIGYGALQLAIVVSDVRLQDSIATGARATVTSVSNVLAEMLAVLVYVGFALGSSSYGYGTLIAVLAGVVLVLAPVIGRWLPDRGSPTPLRPKDRGR